MLKVHFCAFLSTFSLIHQHTNNWKLKCHSFLIAALKMLRKHVVKVPLLAKCIRWEAFKFNDMFIDCCVYKKAERLSFPIVVDSIVIVVDVKVSFLLLVHVRRVYNNVVEFYIHKSRTYLLSCSHSSRCFSG